MKKTFFTAVILSLVFILNGCGGNDPGASAVTAKASGGAATGAYALVAWNDLGMHCIDHDYSVFAILPPYNNLHAQLIDRLSGKLVTSGVTLTYEATTDTSGSLNTTSQGKTNFWQWVLALFGVTLPPDVGLAGNPVPSLTPAPMVYDAVLGFWKAEGLPIVPYDDKENTNYYPMVKVVAKDTRGKVLATTVTVLPVSDELACSKCHSSGTGDPWAQPSPDWVYDTDPQKDWKRNILLLHDNRNKANPLYATALALKGYSSAGLLATSDGNGVTRRPILCASCHPSNALGPWGVGVAGVKQLTTSMHSWHGVHAMDDATGMPLDQTTDRSACYYCHPGSVTQCLRGVMGNAKKPDGTAVLECQSCHGSMSTVGGDRAGWIDVPKCQYCHYQSADGTYVRDTAALDGSGNFRQTTSIFSSGDALYKLGATHGGMQCEACHGSTHAEYATSEANDNLQSTQLQGYPGTIAECSVCHLRELPQSDAGGPHGLHTLGQVWVYTHTKAAKAAPEACTVCHGKDYRGTALSRTFTARSFRSFGPDPKVYAKGQTVSCYDCHTNPPGR
ncbi:MAG TPA: cytochrome C [Geobacteraceae bacterium]